MRHRAFHLSLMSVALPAGLLSACDSNWSTAVKTNPDALRSANPDPEAKSDPSCLAPTKVLAGVSYTCADGKKREGTLHAGVASVAAPACSKDNEKGCLTTEDFASFSKLEREKIVPGRIQAGFALAGVTGTLTFAGPAECASEGEVGCVSTASFAPAATTGLAAKVVAGQSVAGVSGSAAARPGDCGSEGVVGCVSTALFAPAATTGLAVKVVSGQSVAGVSGSAAARPADCGSEGVVGCVSTALFAPAATTGLAVKVVSGQSVAGVSGSAAARPADCGSDGAVGCVVPASGSIKSRRYNELQGLGHPQEA